MADDTKRSSAPRWPALSKILDQHQRAYRSRSAPVDQVAFITRHPDGGAPTGERVAVAETVNRLERRSAEGRAQQLALALHHVNVAAAHDPHVRVDVIPQRCLFTAVRPHARQF